jgi:hypothetical protein
MKTTVVPAQITTVEDRIAGSLTFIQIMLLVIPLILGSTLYAIIPPKIHLTTLKLVLIALQFSFFGSLAIRIRGKILADWLITILRYSLRPRIYVFTKNDLLSRDIPEPEVFVGRNAITKVAVNADDKVVHLNHKINLKSIFDESMVAISVKPSKKGGIDVSLTKI